MIPVTHCIALDDDEIQEVFVRASGPGGQNVNKVSTAVQLRFDVANSPNLPGDVRARLYVLAGNRITLDGVLVIEARRHRTQEQNRRDAVERLVELIRSAAQRPRVRHRTRPTRASQERRVQEKRHRSTIKHFRRKGAADDE